MSCKIPADVLAYIESIERDEPRAGRELHALAAYLRQVFNTEELIFDEELYGRYMSLARYFPFKLFAWEKALTALWLCTFSAPGVPRWKTIFTMLGRGAGKDGFIAFSAFCLVSPYNPAKNYDVDICANNEEQAMRPVLDLVEVLETPKTEGKLKKHYYHTKQLVQGRANKGVIRGRTNNPKSRDGMRSGAIIFNEVHIYENYLNIKVFMSSLGKKEQPRVGIFTSNGDVSDGPLDDYINNGMRILFEGEPDNGFLPFICRLGSEKEVHDPANWPKANPSIVYMPTMQRETQEEYEDWQQYPERNGDFLTKRMGIRKGFSDTLVTDYANVKATNRELPDLSGWSCTAGIDYAELSDWASVNLHFRRGEERYDVNHSWLCLQSKTLTRVQAPWRDWAERGLITCIDDVSIKPELLGQYILDAARRYNVRMLAMDHYRWTLVAEAMGRAGFDAADKSRVKLVRPSDIAQIIPVIDECFSRQRFTWGDCPPLRWAVNNTKKCRSGKKQGTDTGNFYYAKIEAKSRKTDPFMALVASMTTEQTLGTGLPLQAPPIGAISF